FFGVVTDIALGSSDPRLKHGPPEVEDPFIAQMVSGTVAYGTVSVLPNLTMPLVLGDTGEAPVAAKTIPAHFSRAYAASQQDVATVFGEEDQRHFWIGSPLDMDTKVCLDLDELVKRSIGVFGKSGTGKTFLTRLLLVGILQGGRASSLIFDMHSEYGWSGQDTDRSISVKGLKQLFPSQVSTFTLDEASSRRRGSSTDEVVRIGYGDIEPEDIELLRETLNLSEVAASAAHNLQQKFGQREWMSRFLSLEGRSDVAQLAQELGVQPQALGSLLNRLRNIARYGFLEERSQYDAAGKIIEHLERGKHVVLEFGRYGMDLNAYILISNLLSRRIHHRYVELKEAAEGGQGRDPQPVVIVIEEAHKFLKPAVASQTIFGIIARELRKYNVTLMVIDQRPSAIDPEVMSQLGTRLTCLLDNERDIDAVLSGTPGGRQLRGVLSRLEAKQQALIFGHALPMPVVVRVRDYGSSQSYTEFSRGSSRRRGSTTESPEERLEREIKELF
ncbi:MAG TPA: ATP-binding protein, partial [Dehalococcoidia bacterium]|nr:ATP-binding protein [Dehalococcoidia bacterium]